MSDPQLLSSMLAKHSASAVAEAIANADAQTSNAGLPTYSELVDALRIGEHHTNMASDRALSLARISERNGMHGTAGAHTRGSAEAEQAASLIRTLLSRIPS